MICDHHYLASLSWRNVGSESFQVSENMYINILNILVLQDVDAQEILGIS